MQGLLKIAGLTSYAKGGGVGALVGGGLNAAKTAIQNRNRAPEDKKSILGAAGKGAAVGGAIGAASVKAKNSLGSAIPGKKNKPRTLASDQAAAHLENRPGMHDQAHLDNFDRSINQKNPPKNMEHMQRRAFDALDRQSGAVLNMMKY